MALWAWSKKVLVTGICGSASTAYQPAFLPRNQRRTRAIGDPSRSGDVIGKVAEPLAKRKYPQALPLTCPVEQRVELGAQHLADRGRDGRQFLRELDERMAEAVAQAHPRKQGPQTPGGAVEAIGQDASDPVRRLLVECRASKLAIGLSQSGGTGVLGISQMPDHPATDNRRQIHLVDETVTMLLVGHEVGGEGQPTPRQHSDQTVVAECADEAIERHG
jgi:hypothetical protein